jgi:hypothetical protein
MSLKKSLMDVEARMTKKFSELQALIADKLSNEKE